MIPALLLLAGMALVLGGILWLRLPAFLALVLGAYAVAGLTPEDALRSHAAERLAKGDLTAKAAAALPAKPPAARVADEFGRTCASLGVLLAMAAILGQAMMASGAAESIATALLRLTGAARAHWAFFTSSFLLCIPVFFDTVFYLLSPLYRAVGRRVGKNYLLLVMCTVAGGTITHSLVPPTPGPLLAAQMLGVPLGRMIVLGTLVGLGAALFGVVYATWANRRLPQPCPAPEAGESEPSVSRTLPSLGLSLLPVVLPVLLIAAAAVLLPSGKTPAPAWLPAGWPDSAAARALRVAGDKDMAVTLGALIALLPLLRGQGRDAGARTVQAALVSGAQILLVTAAGGAFGGVLQQTGIAGALGAGMAGLPHLALPAVFLLTALVRTAQGSATVAMITAAPIAKAFLDGAGGGIDPVYFALAIGCGSKPFPWMNDSGFWVISRLSGLSESVTLRTVSVMMSLQGVAGLVLTMLCAWWFP